MKELDMKESVLGPELNSVFKLPIHHLDDKVIHKIPTHVSTDLELVSSSDADRPSMYEHLFQPTHEFGRKMIPEWGKHITTNTQYLEDTRCVIEEYSEFIKEASSCTESQCSEAQCTEADCAQVLDIWKSLKKDPRFLDKYSYMEWNTLKYLNESPAFLQCMSFIHLLSPITTVIVPLLSLVVPFILLKLRGIPIDFSTYISVLKDIAKHNFVGKTIMSLQNITNANFVYVIITIAFYCLQMYNNITAFFKYYRNVVQVNTHLHIMRDFVKQCLAKMEAFQKMHINKSTYEAFCRNMRIHIDVLRRLHKELECVSPFSLDVSTLCNLGYMMKCYYILHNDVEYEKSLLYCMGFEGYLDNIHGAYKHYVNGNLGEATFQEDEDTKMTEGGYPPLSTNTSANSAVKNDCCLDKNMIITGVNASGKTTMLKTTTLNILFSQQIGMGFYKTMNLNRPYTHIHSYLNIPDTSGRDSLFQAEARRCKDIIDIIGSAGDDANHFCIFDELYSGTNPVEATKAAYAFLAYLSGFKNVNFMLTTHYTSICKKCKATGRIRNHKMDVYQNENDEFVYTYSMKVGVCYLEGGVEILKSMHYPPEMIAYIEEYDSNDKERDKKK